MAKSLNGPQRLRKRAAPPRQSTRHDEPSEDRSGRLRGVVVGTGYRLNEMTAELDDMKAVLLGHEDPPIRSGALTLMEIADAYFARAADMTMAIQRAERTGHVEKGSPAYLFRTGELRIFMEMAKRASDLGSRRITYMTARVESERTGRSDFDSMWPEGDDS